MVVEADKDRKQLLEQTRLLELKVRKMRAQVHALMLQYFERSSEKLDPNQLQLAIDTVMADDALTEDVSPVPSKPRNPSERWQRRIEDLPILETVRLVLRL